MVVPILSYLKDHSLFPHQRQFPLRPETREGLISIFRELKKNRDFYLNVPIHIILLFWESKRDPIHGGWYRTFDQ
jgi:hypothetical protein